VSYKKLKKDIKRIPNVKLRSYRSSSVHGDGEPDGDSPSSRTPRRRSSTASFIQRSRSRVRIQADANYIDVSKCT
jgi:hypothetical protein